jgi:hypothetical protein
MKMMVMMMKKKKVRIGEDDACVNANFVSLTRVEFGFDYTFELPEAISI